MIEDNSGNVILNATDTKNRISTLEAVKEETEIFTLKVGDNSVEVKYIIMTEKHLFVYRNGLLENPNDYKVKDKTITFNSPAISEDTIIVMYSHNWGII